MLVCMADVTINDIDNMHHIKIPNIAIFCVFLNLIIVFP